MPTVSQHYSPVFHTSSPAAPVVLMVSGGADSTALLLLACSSPLDIQDGRGCTRIARERLRVLHINHHLRGSSSDADEHFVRDLCQELGVPLRVEHAVFDDLEGCNLEGAAREVRYAAARRYVRELCDELGCARREARIVTAHTASDRTETFFMNAIKGSGLAGLSSIPARRGEIVRPLLTKTHRELCHYLEIHGRTWREDESNTDTSYLRNFVRHRLVPIAAQRNASVERAVGSACDILGEEDAFMARLAAQSLRHIIRREQPGVVVLDGNRLASCELVLARRMIRLLHSKLAGDARLEMRHVEAVLQLVARGKGSHVMPGGVQARMEFGVLSLRTTQAAEQLVASWIEVPGRLPLANGMVLTTYDMSVPADWDPRAYSEQLQADDNQMSAVAFVDIEALGYTAAHQVRLWVDAPVPGDVMCPLGMSGRTKKVSDLLNEARLPVADRQQIPVVRTAPEGSIVWIPGVRCDERFKCHAATKHVVVMTTRQVV